MKEFSESLGIYQRFGGKNILRGFRICVMKKSLKKEVCEGWEIDDGEIGELCDEARGEFNSVFTVASCFFVLGTTLFGFIQQR